MTGERRADLGLTLGLLVWGLALFLWPLACGVRVTRDDGFYYFEIAHNVAAGAGSTFDGGHVTNGYHPLWLVCLVPVFSVARDAETALAVGVVLQGLLLCGCAALLYWTFRLTLEPAPAVLGVVCWLAFTHREALSGLEFGVHAATVLASAAVCVGFFNREAFPSSRALGGLGLLLGLAFLARLDNIALACIVGLALFVRARRDTAQREAVRRAAALALPVAGVVMAYAAVNLWLCGHVFPVSGAVKRDWSLYALSQDPYYRSGGLWFAKLREVLWPLRNARQQYGLVLSAGTFGTGAVFLAGSCARGWPREAFNRCLLPWSPFVVFAWVQFLAYALIFHGDAGFSSSPWYFVVQPALTSLLVGVAAEVLWRRGGTIGRGAVAVGVCPVLLGTAWDLRDWQRQGRDRVTYESAEWVRNYLPADAVVGSWHAGAVGYLSGRRVVNLDGLVNSWEYFEVEQHDLCAYWDRNRISHLVDMFDGRHAAVSEPMYGAYAACEGRLEPLWSPGGPGPGWRVAAFHIRPR